MTRLPKISGSFAGYAAALLLLAGVCIGEVATPSGGGKQLNDLLQRTSKQTAALLEEFSDVTCTEQVRQEKLGKGDKVELKEDSTYDYMVIFSSSGGELSLSESRAAIHAVNQKHKNTSMLLSNGFATLFLVFHPYYADSFRFALSGEETMAGRSYMKVHFEHIAGTRSPAALALRGREYPLALSGTAWIDPGSGSIAKITAGVGNTLQDVGLKSMQSEIEFAPQSFNDSRQPSWLPAKAEVEVETPRQHWRNVHRFAAYKKFTVSTEEQVIPK